MNGLLLYPYTSYNLETLPYDKCLRFMTFDIKGQWSRDRSHHHQQSQNLIYTLLHPPMVNANGHTALKLMVSYEGQTFLLYKVDWTIFKLIVNVNDIYNY